jgi:hypothetical protein
VKKPVSKFAFQVHNLQRYNVEPKPAPIEKAMAPIHVARVEVGLCRLNQVDP